MANTHLEGQSTQHSLSSTAKPLGAALGNGSPPGSNVLMDDGTSPGSDIPLGTYEPVKEGTLMGGDIPLDSADPMEKGTLPAGDIILDSDVPMQEGTFLGSDISLHSDIPHKPSATLHLRAVRDPVMIPASNIVLSEKVMLEEAMRCLDCSLGAVGISWHSLSSISMPRDPTICHHKISSLRLLEKMLSAGYSVFKTSKANFLK